MTAAYFLHNGALLPAEQATISLDDIAYAYGFGVYETIRINDGIAYFVDEHIERLLHSAEIIDLEHPLSADMLRSHITDLIAACELTTSNLKILLIGGRTAEAADLYILPLNPLFPDRKLYKTGVHCITEIYERLYPQAKTLNMLPSYLAYRKATKAAAYDALLVNQAGQITEGTRTNFFAMQGETIISPPASDILLGVMRKAVLQVAASNDYKIIEQPILLHTLEHYDAAFLTSTSSKIMPIVSINDRAFSTISEDLHKLIELFAAFYTACRGQLSDK